MHVAVMIGLTALSWQVLSPKSVRQKALDPDTVSNPIWEFRIAFGPAGNGSFYNELGLLADIMHLLRHITSLRGFLQALLALAVLVAPVTANAMERLPAAASHDEKASASAHCGGATENSSKQDKAPGKTCCASMCMGIAVAPSAPAGAEVIVHAEATSSAPTFLIGSPAELATPPPRAA